MQSWPLMQAGNRHGDWRAGLRYIIKDMRETTRVDIRNITVLGSGVMGHGIAQVSAMAGYNIVLRDIKQEFLDKAVDKIRWSLDKMVSKQKITKEDAHDIISRIKPEVEIGQAVQDAHMIIEVVPEIMDLKKKVYAELDGIAGSDVIFASNTSTLPITEIANTTSRPDKFIGIHFFNPPQLMKLVEIIPGQDTSQEVLQAVAGYVKSVKKEGVICRRDVPGFIINRLFIPMVHEACYEVDRTGASLEEVDSAVKFRLGFPMGIFELADFTGMDVIHKATTEMHLRDKKVILPHPRIQRMFEDGKLGQKSGSGFYGYSDDKYERVSLSEDLAAGFDPVRLVANIINNAAWLVTNGASDIEELERAARLGLGLKKPLFETAKNIGITRITGELNRLAEQEEFYRPDPLLARIE